MRVITGRLGGRQFASPTGNRTHPMSDKIRGALFNTLGDITDLTVLDAFAGSGALCFEALSRGAARATALDIEANAVMTIKRNAAELGLSSLIGVSRASVSSWLQTTAASQLFDLVLADPPYTDVQLPAIVGLAERVVPGGLLVVSLPPNKVVALPELYELVAHKQYGDAELWFYRRLADLKAL